MNSRRAIYLLIAISGTSGTLPAVAGETFTDPRDRETYGTVEIAGLRWMTENLRFESPTSACYDDEPENCDNFGRLYSWEAALQACPPGWHLATDFEWQALELALGMRFGELQGTRERGEPLGEKLKAGSDFALTFPLAGYSDPDGLFKRKEEAAAIWTATEADLGHAWHRDLNAARTGIYRSRVFKPWLLSVRCVENRGANDME